MHLSLIHAVLGTEVVLRTRRAVEIKRSMALPSLLSTKKPQPSTGPLECFSVLLCTELGCNKK